MLLNIVERNTVADGIVDAVAIGFQDDYSKRFRALKIMM
jgi:hypothetical protein